MNCGVLVFFVLGKLKYTRMTSLPSSGQSLRGCEHPSPTFPFFILSPSVPFPGSCSLVQVFPSFKSLQSFTSTRKLPVCPGGPTAAQICTWWHCNTPPSLPSAGPFSFLSTGVSRSHPQQSPCFPARLPWDGVSASLCQQAHDRFYFSPVCFLLNLWLYLPDSLHYRPHSGLLRRAHRPSVTLPRQPLSSVSAEPPALPRRVYFP